MGEFLRECRLICRRPDWITVCSHNSDCQVDFVLDGNEIRGLEQNPENEIAVGTIGMVWQKSDAVGLVAFESAVKGTPCQDAPSRPTVVLHWEGLLLCADVLVGFRLCLGLLS